MLCSMVWLTCGDVNDFRRCGQVLQWAIIVRNAYADPLNILQVTATFNAGSNGGIVFFFFSLSEKKLQRMDEWAEDTVPVHSHSM